MSGLTLKDAKGPEGIRLYAIGDVHGRLDLLQDMHGLIRADIDRNPTHDWRIIHLGDYIDRGPNSKGVMDFLIHASTHDPRILSLLGNHDDGFLHYLATGTQPVFLPIMAAVTPHFLMALRLILTTLNQQRAHINILCRRFHTPI